MINKYKKLVPKELKIGGMVYKVSYPWKFRSSESLGLHISYLTEIRVSGFVDNNIMPLSKVYETLFHEIFHAIEIIFLTFPLIHDSVNSFSTGLFQVIVDNDLRLCDERYIPEKVKVGGFIYDVIYPYDFTDDVEPTYASFDKDRLEICLKGKEVDGDINNRFKKLGLVLSILRAIGSVYISDGMIFDLSGNIRNSIDDRTISSAFNTLANGIYQVLVDNDLENIIKKGIKEEKKIKRK